MIQVVTDEIVLNPVFGSDLEEAKQGIFPLEDEAVVEVLLPTMQVRVFAVLEDLVFTSML